VKWLSHARSIAPLERPALYPKVDIRREEPSRMGDIGSPVIPVSNDRAC